MSVRDRTDAEVIVASLDASEMFGEIFRRHFRAVYAYAASAAGRSLGEDIAADAFAAAFAARHQFDPRFTDARPWLLGITTRLVANRYRKLERERNAVHRLTGMSELTTTHEDETISRIQDDRDRERWLLALRPHQREVFALCVYSDLTYQEIADALGIRLGTVKSRFHRACERLGNLKGTLS